MALTAELNVCGNRAADLSRANQTERSEAGLGVNTIHKEKKEAMDGKKKDLLCKEEKELYKSQFNQNIRWSLSHEKNIFLSESVDNIK